MRALWLTSWYPNKLDTMNGDFVQRHARAVAGFCKVDVIHVETDKENKLAQTEKSFVQTGDLSETIILYKPRNFFIFSKLVALWQYYSRFKKEIELYIQKNGLPQIVHVHVPMKAGLLALWLKKKYSIPFVVTEHWTIYHKGAAHNYADRSFAFKYFTKKIFRNADLFLPVSKNLGETICNKVVRVPYHVVPNVVDITHFNLNARNIDANVFRFVHVSTLHEQKNPEGIIRAFAKFHQQFPSTELWIVGGYADELSKLMVHLNVQASIRFLGLLSYEDVAQIMKQCNALVMFSRYENLPCVIVEALCCGLPVISTNVGGVGEVVNDKNGLLVDSEDEEALLQALMHCYNNFSLYKSEDIATNAMNTFSYKVVGAGVEKLYDAVINKDVEK